MSHPPDLGPYRLLGLLSTSERAQVFRATDRRHDDRVVALKVFSPVLSADAEFCERFRRDAAALSALREPHVVPVHTYGELDGALFLDMRLVSGATLAELRAAGRLAPARAAAVSGQISGALAAIAAGGLGPRAVDPAEVLVSGGPGREFVQLVGLGLGRAPATAPLTVAELVGPGSAGRSTWRRRWRWIAAAAVTALVLGVVTTVAVRAQDRPMPPPGALTALSDSAGLAAAAGVVVDGRPLAVGVLADGRLRTWDLTRGDLAGPDIAGSGGQAEAAVVDGMPVVVSRDADQTVRVHRIPDGLAIGDPVGDPTAVQTGSQARAAVPADLDGRPVAVFVEPTDPANYRKKSFDLGHQVRALTDGAAIGPLVSVPGASLSARPVTAVLDGRPVVVTTSDESNGDLIGANEYRVLRVYDMATGAPVGAPLLLPAGIVELRATTRSGRPVAVLGCTDNSVRVVDLSTATVAATLTGHTSAVRQVLVVDLGARTVVMAEAGGSTTSELRFWDLESGQPIGPVLRDHPLAGLLTALRHGDRTLLLGTTAPGVQPGTAAVWSLEDLLGEGGS
ncbi:hypothetical protein [Pseudonocardia sp. TRM90224]|uniref:hypothetical protein n=1 Tax=Pseudonocardia sp. TRM90224 TaxID=2812678 RepID=UPI001E30B3AC|nr:hypothetical protein [Pseudonocardia sp. TRM90224]